MKTILFSLAASAALATGIVKLREDESPSCCAAPESVAAAVPSDPPLSPAPEHKLPARSLYQLERDWTTDTGGTFRLRSLAGKPVVIAMFFSSCQYACPLLVADLQRMRASLPAAIRRDTQFVLVSFDTTRDTPAALREYRGKMGLDSGWTLLRGDPGSVQELAMLLGVKYKQAANGDFSHSNLFTVLSRGGEIVHQRSGLGGDVSEAAEAVSGLFRP